VIPAKIDSITADQHNKTIDHLFLAGLLLSLTTFGKLVKIWVKVDFGCHVDLRCGLNLSKLRNKGIS
jgi:hypothetical protein